MNEVVIEPIELEEVSYQTNTGNPLIERNLGLLGHVKVRLEVLLGNAEVSVEKLFSLTKGDSLELDTSLDSPVSLLLDGKPIARGHLMASGDNFGL
jgi:flagellar motor switch protein FliN/FliY